MLEPLPRSGQARPPMTCSPSQQRWLLIFAGAIPAAYVLFFLLTWNRVGPKDFDQFLVFHELQYWNRALFGFAKQWTPLLCGGLPMSGEPQIPVMSLSMLLSYLVGPLLGIKLASLAYLVTGWVGAYLYAGLWRSDKLTRVLAASLFIGNGFFVYRMAVGHVDFVPFLVLPLALWSLHRTLSWQQYGSVAANALRAATLVAAYAIGIAVVVDGSPVAVIHLLFWVCLYALVLSYHERSFAPGVTLCCAIAIAAVLDAGYLWPMLTAQAEFPRHTADTFTDPVGLFVHALLPLRGKITHGSGKGHELTVFIGPILAFLIWRYRKSWSGTLPRSMLQPLLVVSLISILFGMGSLRHLHIPNWLSPFDLLRPLPGFRSMGVTARYWGFLSLPLSLLGAAALQHFISEAPAKQVTAWLSIALVLQLGSQFEAFWSQWNNARVYSSVNVQSYFRGRRETMSYVAAPSGRLQGEFITPTRAVVNCYDMDDFVRAPAKPGRNMAVAEANYVVDKTPGGIVTKISLPVLKSAAPTPTSDTAYAAPSPTDIKLLSWNHLQLRDASAVAIGTRVIVLNQAWNSRWSAAGCDVLRGPADRLGLRCSNEQLRKGVDLVFADQVSTAGAEVSARAWPVILILLTGCLAILALRRLRVANQPYNAID